MSGLKKADLGNADAGAFWQLPARVLQLDGMELLECSLWLSIAGSEEILFEFSAQQFASPQAREIVSPNTPSIGGLFVEQAASSFVFTAAFGRRSSRRLCSSSQRATI